MQPIYKGYDKDKSDPASYRGLCLNDTLAKLFEGRLTTHIELNNIFTSKQLGTKPCTQTQDAIYSLLSTIQYNNYALQKPSYVACVDYSTTYLPLSAPRQTVIELVSLIDVAFITL